MELPTLPRARLTAVLAATVLGSVVAGPPPAVAAPPAEGPPSGVCTYYAVSDPRPTASADAMVGVLRGGPQRGDGTLVCTMVRDVNRHDGPALWSEEQPSTNGVAVLPPRTIEWDSPVDHVDYLCTSWRDPAGTTYYWYPGARFTGPWRDDPGHWSTDPTVACRLPTDLGPAPPAWFFDLITFVFEQVHPPVCPVLQARHSGPYDPQEPYRAYVDDDGDLYLDDDGDGRIEGDELWWDCPPLHTGDF